MEEKRGLFTSIGGVLRFLLGILIVIIVAFLLVRFITGRQDTKKSDQASRPSTQEVAKEDSKKTANNTGTEKSSDSSQDSGETIPSGVAESEDTPNEATSTDLPDAGMGSDILITSFALSVVTFMVVEGLRIRGKAVN